MIIYIILLFVEPPRKFITAKLSIRKPGSSSSNEFTWCLHKQKYYMFYRHANLQRTYNICIFEKAEIRNLAAYISTGIKFGYHSRICFNYRPKSDLTFF
jgi:hypothetical protein